MSTDREVYLELIQLGNALRAAAIDAATGEEVVFQVPSKTSRPEIERLAMAKLDWKLRKDSGNKKRPEEGSGRGIKV